MQGNKAVWLVLVFALLTGGLVWWKFRQQSSAGSPPAGGKPGGNPALSVSAVVIKTDTLASDEVFSGTLLAWEEVMLMPEIAGRIAIMNMEEGRQVSRGTLLLSLADEDLKAQEDKLRLQEQISIRNLGRLKALEKSGAGTSLEADAAENQLNNIQADLRILEANRQKTRITAPFSGQLGFCDLRPGAWITPGTAVAWLRNTRKLKLEFSVPEKYALSFKEGERVNFSADGVPLSGKIYAMDAGLNPSTHSLNIRAEVDNSAGKLKAGGFVLVKPSGKTIADALLVPAQSIIPDNRGKKVILYHGGKAEFREVETGIRTTGRVQVLSGISAGDTVLTNGLMFAKPGSDLKISHLDK